MGGTGKDLGGQLQAPLPEITAQRLTRLGEDPREMALTDADGCGNRRGAQA
ncbi:hypothetical protein GCM10025778_13450 [Paeniglutamicibacter antarcticus]|uniref:Uncharacterized protein n=1 Tax=Paeniglutamicibacter antarcticus TaxID=494023 RepID=A0ABP9TM66_9MICC